MGCSFPRPATPYECEALHKFYKFTYGCDDMIPECVMVMEDYITGGPCYAGELWIAVWDGAPEFVDVFTLKPSEVCAICGDGVFWHGNEDQKGLHKDSKDHIFKRKYLDTHERLELVLCGADPTRTQPTDDEPKSN